MMLTVDFSSAFPVILGVVFAAVVALILALLVKKIRNFFASRSFQPSDRQAMRRRWTEIERAVETQGEMSRKMAVLEADKLLDSALKALAMPGDTLGDRLKFAQYKYPALRDVWWAHRVRNQLAHEASYHLDAGVAKRALKTFKEALERLGAI